MNIHINHFSLGARNAFESAARLRKETGLSFWTGEWVRDISCHMVPLGNGPHGKDAFIEIQCPVDAHAHLKDPRPNYRYDVLSVDNEYHGDYWTGLMLGVDSLADLEAIAKRLGGDVTPEDSRTNPYAHFQRPDGYVLGYQSAPRFTRGARTSGRWTCLASTTIRTCPGDPPISPSWPRRTFARQPE